MRNSTLPILKSFKIDFGTLLLKYNNQVLAIKNESRENRKQVLNV